MSFRVAPGGDGESAVEMAVREASTDAGAAAGGSPETKGVPPIAGMPSGGATASPPHPRIAKLSVDAVDDGSPSLPSPVRMNTFVTGDETPADASAQRAAAGERAGASFVMDTETGNPISPRTAALRAQRSEEGGSRARSDSEDSAGSKDSQYNNVTLEDIEYRLATSYVYTVKTDDRCQNVRLSIDPRGNFSRQWDVVMLVCLLFTAFVTPYEIAFLGTGKGALLVVNRCVDVLFLSDMFVNFFMGFFDEDDGAWVFENTRIAKRYLTGWFGIDLVSILPYDYAEGLVGSGSSQLKILRLVRLLRLIKLARVLRASRMFKRFELSTDLPYAMQKLIKYAAIVTLAVHWCACLWRLSPTLSGLDDPHWINSYPDEIPPEAQGDPVHLYVRSFYTAMSTLPMGVPGVVVATTTTERWVTIIAMLVTGSIYGYLIGEICDTVSNLDPASNEFKQMMDHLNDYMTDIRLPDEKKRQVREYFHHCTAMHRYKFYHHLLELMSPHLRMQTSMHMHAVWIEQIQFFRCDDDEEREQFISAVAMALEPEAYAPKEVVIKPGDPTDKMYIVQRGLVAREGHVYGAGRFFGEDVILQNSKRNYFVRVLTYLDVHALARDDIDQILDEGDFPRTRKLIRMAAVRLALSRELVRIAANARAKRFAAAIGIKDADGAKAAEVMEERRRSVVEAKEADMADRFENMEQEEVSRRASLEGLMAPGMAAAASKQVGAMALAKQSELDKAALLRKKPEPALKFDMETLTMRLGSLEERLEDFTGTMQHCFDEYRVILQYQNQKQQSSQSGSSAGKRRRDKSRHRDRDRDRDHGERREKRKSREKRHSRDKDKHRSKSRERRKLPDVKPPSNFKPDE